VASEGLGALGAWRLYFDEVFLWMQVYPFSHVKYCEFTCNNFAREGEDLVLQICKAL
jgi:hypothetical protein